ncbi:hypothetical protein EDD11_007471 [Mortierella claussenii]|nr:hypothetical protein EDD11_007471 [Mortierella claussenii]
MVVYIPSRNDGCMLEVCLSIPTTVSSQPQVHTGVVIAHPYGPLGGSYNNNVVGAMLQWFETSSLQAAAGADVASGPPSELLGESTPLPPQKKSQKNQMASGCGKSKGKTSWFGEAERDDYQTIVDFLQSGSHPGRNHLESAEQNDSAKGTSTAAWSGKIYDETGSQIDSPRLPFISRFILSGFSYGGMVASTIAPPLKTPSNPSSGHLPTTYILVSYPAGVAWFLTSGSHGSFSKRAREILCGESVPKDTSSDATVGGQRNQSVEAYFITGSQDQFTSPKTLLSWLKANAGLSPPKMSEGSTSWTLKRPDGAIHLDVLDNVDHFWLDREPELLDHLQRWWMETHARGTTL